MAVTKRTKASKLLYRLPPLVVAGPRYSEVLGSNTPGLRIEVDDTTNRLIGSKGQLLGLPEQEDVEYTPYADSIDYNWLNEWRQLMKKLCKAVHEPVSGVACDWIANPNFDISAYTLDYDTFIPVRTLTIPFPAGGGGGALANPLQYIRTDKKVGTTTGTPYQGSYCIDLPEMVWRTYTGTVARSAQPATPQGIDYTNGYLLVAGTLQSMGASGIWSLTMDITGVIHNAIASGTDDNANVIITLTRGWIDTTWNTATPVYDTYKRLVMFSQTTGSSVTVQFKRAEHLYGRTFVLRGISATGALPVYSRIFSGALQLPLPLTPRPSTFQGSSRLFGLTHNSSRLVTFAVSPTAFPSSGTASGFISNSSDSKAYVLNFSGMPSYIGEVGSSGNGITGHRLLYDGSDEFFINETPINSDGTATSLLAWAENHPFLDDAEPADYANRADRVWDLESILKNSITEWDYNAWKFALNGPKQSFLVNLLNAGATNAYFRTTRGGVLTTNEQDSGNYPDIFRQFNNDFQCNVLVTFDRALNRFFAWATGKVVADGAFSEDAMIVSWKPYSTAGTEITALTLDATNKRVIRTSDGANFDAPLHLGVHRPLGTNTTATGVSMASAKGYKGRVYGINGSGHLVSSSGGTLQTTLVGTLREGGLADHTINPGAINTILGTLVSQRRLNVMINGIPIQEDLMGASDGSGVFAHPILGINNISNNNNLYDAVCTNVVTYSQSTSNIDSTPLPAGNPSTWSTKTIISTGTPNTDGFQYTTSGVWKASGPCGAGRSPFIYQNGSGTISCKVNVFRLPGINVLSSTVKKRTDIVIQVPLNKFAGQFNVADSASYSGTVKYGFPTSNTIAAVDAIIPGGTTLYSFTVPDLRDWGTVISGNITLPPGATYVAVWVESSNRPVPASAPPPTMDPQTGCPADQFAFNAASYSIFEGTQIFVRPVRGCTVPSFFNSNTSQSYEVLINANCKANYGQISDFFIPKPSFCNLDESHVVNGSLLPTTLLVPKPTGKICGSTMSPTLPPGMFTRSMTELNKVIYASNDVFSFLASYGQPGLAINPLGTTTLVHIGGAVTQVFNLNQTVGSVSIVSGEVLYTATSECGYDWVIAYDDYNKVPAIMPITVTRRRVGTQNENANFFYFEGLMTGQALRGSPIWIRPTYAPSYACAPVVERVTFPNATTTSGLVAGSGIGLNDCSDLKISQAPTPTSGHSGSGQTGMRRLIPGIAPANQGNLRIETFDSTSGFTSPIEDITYKCWTVGLNQVTYDPTLPSGDTIICTSTDGARWEPYLVECIPVTTAGTANAGTHYACLEVPFNDYFTTSDGITWTFNIPSGWSEGRGGRKFAVVGKSPGERVYAISKIFTQA